MKNKGFTLIETVMFIVIVSLCLSGIVLMYATATRNSAFPNEYKQSSEIASSLIDEITSMPMTYCRPTDTAVYTATGTASCSTVQTLLPASGATRHSLTNQFSNVGDYGGYTESSIKNIKGQSIANLSGYSVVINETYVTIPSVSAQEAIQIEVVVTAPSGNVLKMYGYRFMHSPNVPG